jgi:two-component system, cell cycle response regulator DivK
MKGSVLPSGLTRRDPTSVLIAEHVESHRTLYVETLLFFSNYRVIEAANGQDAVEKARRLRPRVLVISLALPKLGGWDAVRSLKRDAFTRDIRIIGIAQQAQPDDRERARDFGLDVLVEEPYAPTDLREHVKWCLSVTTSKPSPSVVRASPGRPSSRAGARRAR